MNRQQFHEQIFDEFQRDLVRPIGEGVCRVRVDFHEKAFQASGHSRAGQNGGEFSIATSRAEPAGALDGVGRIKNHRDSLFAHDVERAHIDDEIVIAEGRAFSAPTPLGAKMPENSS
jgi:hypothetical protein